MDRARIEELFAPFGPVVIKAMFGGFGVYADELIFAVCAGGEVYLKCDGETRDAFIAAGARPFVYEARGKTVALPYYSLSEEAFDDEAALRRWCALALEAARRPGASKGPAPRKRRVRVRPTA